MADFPLQKRSPITNRLEPTLLPNFSPIVANHGLHHIGPDEVVADYAPRVASDGVLTLSGTPATGSGTLSIQNGVLGASAIVLTIATTTGDTLDQVAAIIADAVNANADLTYFGFSAEVLPDGTVQVSQPSGVGNFTTITWTAGTTAVAIAVTQMTGGSGATIPLNNFNFVNGSAIVPLWYGIPRDLSYATLKELVSQGLPVM